MMNNRMSKVMLAAVLVVSVNATAASVTMKDLASGAVVGQVELSESPYGAVFTPALSSLPAGLHGFHVHANGAATAVLRMGKALRVARRVVTMIPSKQGAMAPPGKMMSTREIYHLSMSMR